MKNKIERFKIMTHEETEMIDITQHVRDVVKQSGIDSGLVMIISMHTTTAITVNECLPDLESDIKTHMEKLVPDDQPYYRHARFLHSDGQMAINAPSHIRGALLGFECYFPVENGEMVTGGRQTIYFVELDGPQERNYIIQIMGE